MSATWPEADATLAAGRVRCLGSTCRRSVGPNPPLVCRVADAAHSDASTRANGRVGNWPRDEIAEGGAPRVRLALWGFELARRDDGGGSAP
jgi:hypothetical protein